MKGFATVNLAGNITADPEVRYRTNGDPVVSFCVAVNRIVKSEFHARPWTDYIDCFNVGDDAEGIAVSFKKGDAVDICGKLEQQRKEIKGRMTSRLAVNVATISHVQSPADVKEPACA